MGIPAGTQEETSGALTQAISIQHPLVHFLGRTPDSEHLMQQAAVVAAAPARMGPGSLQGRADGSVASRSRDDFWDMHGGITRLWEFRRGPRMSNPAKSSRSSLIARRFTWSKAATATRKSDRQPEEALTGLPTPPKHASGRSMNQRPRIERCKSEPGNRPRGVRHGAPFAWHHIGTEAVVQNLPAPGYPQKKGAFSGPDEEISCSPGRQAVLPPVAPQRFGSHMNTLLSGELGSIHCGARSPHDLGITLIPGDQILEAMKFM